MSKKIFKKSLKLFEDEDKKDFKKVKCVKKSLKFKKSKPLLEVARQNQKMNHFKDNVQTLNKLSSIKVNKQLTKELLHQPCQSDQDQSKSSNSSVFSEKDFKKFFRHYLRD